MAKAMLLFTAIFSFSLLADQPNALVKIDITALSPKDILEFRSLNVDIAHIDQLRGRMDALISPSAAAWLSRRGVSFTPLISDLSAYAQQLRQSGYFSHFRSYPQMLAEMQEIVRSYPNLASMHDIGDSYLKTVGRGGYDVWALKISDDVATEDSTEADVLYMANIHAREIITPEVLFYFIRHLIDNYGRDAYVTHLVNNRELWFVPSINPDGHEYVFQGDPDQRDSYSRLEPLWWRKNMRDNNENGIFDAVNDGVDLNRNFGFAWGIDDNGSSPDPMNGTYRGEAAFSEPEAQNIREFVKQHQFVISLSYHSYSNLWLYPWGYTYDPLPEQDAAIFEALADSCVYYNNYLAQRGADLYLVNGDTDDWLYGEFGIWAFSPEVGLYPDDGFFPDTTRILPLVQENLGANLYVAWAAGEEPIVEYQPLPDTLEQQAFFNLAVTVAPPLPLTDSVALDSSSFKVYYRSAFEQRYSVAPMSFVDSAQSFLAAIPGDKLSGMVYYYAEARDKSGTRGAWPRGAPLAVDSFYVKYPFAVEKNGAPSASFRLFQNYPNPFNASTTIPFYTARDQFLKISIYDLGGRRVKALADKAFVSGSHSIVWNGKDDGGKDVSTGLYYCRLDGESQSGTIKLLLLK